MDKDHRFTAAAMDVYAIDAALHAMGSDGADDLAERIGSQTAQMTGQYVFDEVLVQLTAAEHAMVLDALDRLTEIVKDVTDDSWVHHPDGTGSRLVDRRADGDEMHADV